MTNDPPKGSPVIVIEEIPDTDVSVSSSLGELPTCPDIASSLENKELVVANTLFVVPNALRVNTSAYVKYALKLYTGVAKVIVIGPPLSETTFVPEWGGNSNSFRLIPEVRMIASVNVTPEY
jgi:hypothetical protein